MVENIATEKKNVMTKILGRIGLRMYLGLEQLVIHLFSYITLMKLLYSFPSPFVHVSLIFLSTILQISLLSNALILFCYKTLVAVTFGLMTFCSKLLGPIS
jgi:hypothetical protein